MKHSIVIFALFMAACGGGQSEAPNAASTAATGLSAAQLEHGIGPVEAFDPGPIDPNLADHGQEVFTIKCSACHKMDTRYVGPPLGDVTSRRSPAYVMNMILNPAEMVEKHPEAKALFAQFMTPMPNQSLTKDEARAVLEYLRRESQATE
jgi:mono/diheme cytochrome c family protein